MDPPVFPRRDSLNSGQSFDAALDFVQRKFQLRFLGDVAELRADVDDGDVVRVEAGIDGEQDF